MATAIEVTVSLTTRPFGAMYSAWNAATAYDNLVGVASEECDNETRVVAGDADESLLVQAVEGTACIDRMPDNRDPLTAQEIMTIRAWITGGAVE